MDNSISYFTLIGFLCFFADAKGQTIHQDYNLITINAGWNLCVPDGFIWKGHYGVDSYMGTISSKKDSIQLQFDIMPRPYGSDCSLEAQTKIRRRIILNSDLTEELYDVPAINRIYIDTINNRIATIVVPQNIGKGRTMIHIVDCLSGSNLFITAHDLNAQQQNLVLAMFHTIRYSNEDNQMKIKINH